MCSWKHVERCLLILVSLNKFCKFVPIFPKIKWEVIYISVHLISIYFSKAKDLLAIRSRNKFCMADNKHFFTATQYYDMMHLVFNGEINFIMNFFFRILERCQHLYKVISDVYVPQYVNRSLYHLALPSVLQATNNFLNVLLKVSPWNLDKGRRNMNRGVSWHTNFDASDSLILWILFKF